MGSVNGKPAFFFLLLACILVGAAFGPMTGQAQAQVGIPLLEPSVCPPGVPEAQGIECSYLVVPEDYAAPNGQTIRLPVFRIQAQNGQPAPDAILFIAGGPGAPALSALEMLADSPFRAERDIIILEQRGAGQAEPDLTCDVSLLENDALPCLENLLSRNITLSHFTSGSMIADLNALREALPYEEWNLFGQSYSTLLMLLAMGSRPEGIRSLVLDSTHPPGANPYVRASENYSQALDAFFDECAISQACTAAYPDLKSRFYKLVDSLNAKPVVVNAIDSSTEKTNRVAVDGNWLLAQTFDALYGDVTSADALAYWPLFISLLEQGKFELIAPWISEPVIDWEEALTFGLYFSVMCQDVFPRADPELLAAQAKAFPALEGWAASAFGRRVCEAWKLPPTPSLTPGALENEIPTLILAGEHDPVTPPSWGQDLARGLGNASIYKFPFSGHLLSQDNPCAQQIIAEFLADPRVAPDASCITRSTEPPFVLPSDIRLEPGIYRLVNDLYSDQGHLLRKGLVWLSALLFSAELLYLALALLRLALGNPFQFTPGRWAARLGHPLAGLVAVLNLGFLAGLSRAIIELTAQSPLVLRFGLPAEYGLLPVLPIISEVLTAILMVFAFLIWIMGYWPLRQRLFFSLVTLATVTFASLMAYWNLSLLS